MQDADRGAGQMETVAIADELSAAYAERRTDVVPPSLREGTFDLATAYAVEAELARRRVASGRTVVGRKVGYANKAMWRALKLDTLVWASMYDDTVQYAADNHATLAVERMVAPKIEPEIVVRVGSAGQLAQAGERALESRVRDIEWLALGFEIIDCVFADWKFQPADFVAAYGLHAALVVGQPLPVTADNSAALAEALATFSLTLARDGEVVAHGSGKNALRSPAACVAELEAALQRRAGAQPIRPGELVSTGTLTESQRIARGNTWTASVDGLALPPLTLRIV